MDELIKAVGLEALKTWGAFGLCLILLGAIAGALWRNNRAKDLVIEKREAEITRLQELRLQDARQMIDVTKTGTETIAARAQGDAEFRVMMGLLLRQAFPAQAQALLPLPPIPPESR